MFFPVFVLTAEWELRIDTFRVFYDLDEESLEVKIEAVGYKKGNQFICAWGEVCVMRTITVSKRAKNLVILLKQAQQENLILQSLMGRNMS